VLATRRVPREQIARYGILDVARSNGRVHEVVDMVEKPDPGDAPSDLAIFGRYVLNPAVFEELRRTEPGAGKEIQLTDAIKRTIAADRVVAIEFEGDYYDTGTIPGYLKANLALALKRDGLREELIELIRELVESDAVSRSRNRSL
jgi:UTP--glucose-1-phosphate uridylyltransferase